LFYPILSIALTERSLKQIQALALGGNSLNEPDENEEDMLDRAWGLCPQSRLSCQAIVANIDLVIEIPKYSINHAKENH